MLQLRKKASHVTPVQFQVTARTVRLSIRVTSAPPPIDGHFFSRPFRFTNTNLYHCPFGVASDPVPLRSTPTTS
jgi:hypothetical protein